MEQPPSFDLRTRGWIKVRSQSGAIEEVGLIELFERAHEFVALAGDSTLQDYSVFRLLSAVLWRATVEQFDLAERPRDSTKLWKVMHAENSLARVTGPYLEKLSDRFDLFHPERPFYQVATLETSKGEYPGPTRLVPDVGGLFSSRIADPRGDAMEAGEAARWVVYTQAYDVSGIKPGVVGDPVARGGRSYPIGVGFAGAVGAIQLLGTDLRDTLLLNVPYRVLAEQAASGDLPPWEREVADSAGSRFSEAAIPAGPVEAFTWQQRRIHLWPGEGDTVTAVLVTNGDKVQVANNFTDPSTSYRYSTTQSKAGADVYFPKKHDPNLTVWRGIQGIFAAEYYGNSEDSRDGKSRSRPARPVEILNQYTEGLGGLLVTEESDSQLVTPLRIVGIDYGTQDSVILKEIIEAVPVSAALLAPESVQFRYRVVDAIEAVLSFRGSFAYYLKQLERAAGGTPEEEPKGPIEAWLSEMEQVFVRWLSRLGIDTEDGLRSERNAVQEWRREFYSTTLRHIDDAARAAGPSAEIGFVDESGALHSAARYRAWAVRKLAALTIDLSRRESSNNEVKEPIHE